MTGGGLCDCHTSETSKFAAKRRALGPLGQQYAGWPSLFSSTAPGGYSGSRAHPPPAAIPPWLFAEEREAEEEQQRLLEHEEAQATAPDLRPSPLERGGWEHGVLSSSAHSTKLASYLTEHIRKAQPDTGGSRVRRL